MSEHKFLRILQGYAEGTPIQALAPTTHVSGKTIRATYATLRAHLPVAISTQPERFSGAGLVLSHHETPALFHAARRSPVFRRHRRRHAPRLKCPDEELEHVYEITVRLLCALDLREVSFHEDGSAVREIVLRLAEAVPRLHPRAPLQKLAALIPGAKPHAHPELRLYEDYRRYLLKNPLRTQGSLSPNPPPQFHSSVIRGSTDADFKFRQPALIDI
ncbi:hypothetical protein [Candidatus Filomicrobium marinum]|nr:hypothetical protein [Candidatus Filomicrobium marinum]